VKTDPSGRFLFFCGILYVIEAIWQNFAEQCLYYIKVRRSIADKEARYAERAQV